MDFYYAMTNYHILCCLLHKMCINKNKGVLYISSFIRYNQPNIVENILKSGIFEEVYFYEELEYTKTKKLMTPRMLKEEMDRLCREVEASIGSIIRKANNLYICSDFYSIGLYLITNKINYNYFEDGSGTISKPYLPFRIIEKENPNRAAIVKQIKALGENEYVLKRYAALNNQEKGYHNEKDIDFDVEKILKKLNSKEIKKILDIYEVKKIKIDHKGAVLLLTMHYNELMSIEEQKKIYTSLIDYFVDDNQQIIIKPHPADTINDYDKVFKGSKTINRYMPAELFPYCINNSFEKGITCWSTAIYNLGSVLKRIVNFDTRIDTSYKDFDKYYAIVEILKKIKSDNKINIICKNTNELQLEKLLDNHIKGYKKYFTFNEKGKNSIYIVDKIDEKLKNEQVISLDYDINAKSLIHITKKSSKNVEDLFISLYNIKNIDGLSAKKHLKYSNADLLINSLNETDFREVLHTVIDNYHNNLNKMINEYEKESSDLEKIIEEQNNTLNSIYNSTSWKITKKKKKIVDVIRKIKK